MTQIVLELPDEVAAQLEDRQVSGAHVNDLLIDLLRAWLQSEARSSPATPQTSPFSESAIPFVDGLIAENRQLFERLAQLPDDAP